MARQLGRAPRGTWRVAVRCPHGRPAVIATSPEIEDGAPFPTTFWLSCPYLVRAVHASESAGEGVAWERRVREDEALRSEVLRADVAYRAARSDEGAGRDPCASTGVAGQSDPLAVKCLHARLAALLAGVPDPIGAGLWAGLGWCADDECARLLPYPRGGGSQ